MATSMSPSARRDFWLQVVGQFLAYSGFFAFFQFPLFIKSTGGDEGTIGLIMGISTIAATFFMPLQGGLMKRLPLKPLILWGIIVVAGVTLACQTLTEPGILMAGLMLARGLGFSFAQNASSTLLARLIPKKERARALGIVFAGNTAATAIGPALGEQAILHSGFPALFWTSFSLTMAGALSIGLMHSSPVMEPAGPFRVAAAYREFFRDLASPRLRFLFLTLLAMACAIAGLFNFTATYTRGMALSSGVFFIAFSGMNMLARVTAGGLSDRLGRRMVVLPSILLFSLGILAYSYTEGMVTMILGGMLTGFGFSLINPTITAQMLDQTPARIHGTAMVSFHFAYSVGMMVATPVLGAVAAAYGYQIMWWGLAAVVLMGGAVYLTGERSLAGRMGEGEG